MNSRQLAADRSGAILASSLPYSVLLREHTRTAHRACERAMDLGAALNSHGAYRSLLRRMQTGYMLLAADTCVYDGERLLNRPGSIAADLMRLAHDLESEPADASLAAEHLLVTETDAIGAQYVLAGSRLGGRVIVKTIMAKLPGARVSFFTGDDGDEAQTWCAFQRQLDELGRSGQHDYALVLRGAARTFALIAQALSGCLQCQ